MRRILVFLVFTFISFQISAQQDCAIDLHGHVEDDSGNDLPGAAIIVNNTTKGTVTDLSGAFNFTGLCKGEYVLIVSYVAFKTDTLRLYLTKNQSVSIGLTPDEMVLTNINIIARKSNESNASYSLSGEELERTRGQTLGETIKKISGVTTLQTGPGIVKPVIHGLHSNRVLILNNGVRQEGQQWGSEHAPEIDPFIASKITVVKGADAVKYGSDAIGGLILVEPPDLHTTYHFGGEVNVSGATNGRMGLVSSSLEGPIAAKAGQAWRLQGTLKRAGDAFAPNYQLTNTGIGETNISAGLAFHKEKKGTDIFISRFDTDLGILSSAHIGNLTDLERALVSDTPRIVEDFSYKIQNPRQKVVHHLAKVKSYYFFEDGQKLEVQYGGQLNHRKEFDIRRTNSQKPALDLLLQSHSFDINLGKEKNNRSRSVGISQTWQTNRYDHTTGKAPLIPWFNQSATGAFYLSKWSFEKWETEVGVRYDYKYLLVQTFDRSNNPVRQAYNFHNVAATVGIQYDLNEKLSLSSHLGSGWRPPHVSELFSNGVHHGTATYEKGLLIGDNEDLLPNLSSIQIKPENSVKWISRLFTDLPWVSLDASIYHHLINNFIYLSPRPGDLVLTSRGAFPVFQYLQTNTYLRGIDGTVSVPITKKFEYLFKASFVRANDRNTGAALVMVPADQYENTLQLEFEGGENIEDIHFSLGTLYVGKQARVDPASDFSAVPEGYFLVNFHAGVTIPLKRHTLNFYLNADNLLNQSYRDYMNRLRYFADDLGRNITLRIKYDFHRHD